MEKDIPCNIQNIFVYLKQKFLQETNLIELIHLELLIIIKYTHLTTQSPNI